MNCTGASKHEAWEHVRGQGGESARQACQTGGMNGLETGMVEVCRISKYEEVSPEKKKELLLLLLQGVTIPKGMTPVIIERRRT